MWQNICAAQQRVIDSKPISVLLTVFGLKIGERLTEAASVPALNATRSLIATGEDRGEGWRVALAYIQRPQGAAATGFAPATPRLHPHPIPALKNPRPRLPQPTLRWVPQHVPDRRLKLRFIADQVVEKAGLP